MRLLKKIIRVLDKKKIIYFINNNSNFFCEFVYNITKVLVIEYV